MRHIEENMQIACARWFGLQYPCYAQLLHHSPNGGRRNYIEAARFKAMGTKAGFPDFVLFHPSTKHHALFIELKTKTGRQSPEQKEWQKAVEAQGYRYEVVRTFEQFYDIVTDYMRE